ncbi:MAG: hypothetical protein COB15_07825 [Flavobacteriales bacterium]|nr:MAG: hypothetical protein COB15_07825 [Flavobacteriales bacterium]
MATANSPKSFFNLESRPNKDGTRLIYFNMSYGYFEYNQLTGYKKYIPLRISTKERLALKDWDKVNEKPTASYRASRGKDLGNNLERIKNICEDELLYYNKINTKIPEPKELKRLVEVKLDRRKEVFVDITIKSFIVKLIEHNKSLSQTAKGKIGDKQIEKYETVVRQLSGYEEELGKPITFMNFNNNNFFEFLDYTNKELQKNPLFPHGYLVNSIAKNANTFSALLRKARAKRVEMILDLDDENLRINEVEAVDSEVFISEANLEKIINANVCGSQEFINARNYLIICSLTSLRYQDMQHLHELEVEDYENKGVKFKGFITLIRKVSSIASPIEVCIPILRPVQDVLNENDGRFPKFPSNQVMNRQLKKFSQYINLDEEVGVGRWYYKYEEPVEEYIPFYKLVKCHIGRSSYVTNMAEMGILHTVTEYITHPTTPKNISQSIYNKASLVAKATLLVNELKEKSKSDIYLI